MPNPYFKFKQFTIYQDRCAMKVGTDGVLLGAWANTANATRILDIGTGTGLIAIMLAQRAINASIMAIEIDTDAYRQATENIAQCPWANNIQVYEGAFQQFASAGTAKYNLIVSNPPYFVNALKAPDKNRNIARHTDLLPHAELLQGVKNILEFDGRFAVIMPYTEGLIMVAEAVAYGLFCNRKTFVKVHSNANPKRLLLEFALNPQPVSEDTLVIHQNNSNAFTEKYIQLLKDYYLYF